MKRIRKETALRVEKSRAAVLGDHMVNPAAVKEKIKQHRPMILHFPGADGIVADAFLQRFGARGGPQKGKGRGQRFDIVQQFIVYDRRNILFFIKHMHRQTAILKFPGI